MRGEAGDLVPQALRGDRGHLLQRSGSRRGSVSPRRSGWVSLGELRPELSVGFSEAAEE